MQSLSLSPFFPSLLPSFSFFLLFFFPSFFSLFSFLTFPPSPLYIPIIPDVQVGIFSSVLPAKPAVSYQVSFYSIKKTYHIAYSVFSGICGKVITYSSIQTDAYSELCWKMLLDWE